MPRRRLLIRRWSKIQRRDFDDFAVIAAPSSCRRLADCSLFSCTDVTNKHQWFTGFRFSILAHKSAIWMTVSLSERELGK